MSFDPVDRNKAFHDAESLPFPLLSDVDHEVGRIYGTKRPDDDQRAPWAKRYTFLIDPQGVVRKVYEVRDVGPHADEVLADLISTAAH